MKLQYLVRSLSIFYASVNCDILKGWVGWHKIRIIWKKILEPLKKPSLRQTY